MDRNSESYFSNVPVIEGVQRSKFYMNWDHKTTFNAGRLIPLNVSEVLPGDTWKIDLGMAMRMTTPLFPVMDNANIDIYFFYTPARILWDHWKELNGENRTTYWEQPISYEVPTVKAPDGGWAKGTIADHFAIPTYISGDNAKVNALPFRALAMIWNEWFRDQNLKDPCLVLTDDTSIVGSNGDDYINDVVKGGMPPKVAKYHDYFTSCLPNAQKADAVKLPLGVEAPVYAGDAGVATPEAALHGWHGLHFVGSNGGELTGKRNTIMEAGTLKQGATTTESTSSLMYPDNLYADLRMATSATINELRLAFQLQKLFERDAFSGSRYREILRSHFGTISPDGRQQIPEYLGGARIPINVNQVIQTSSTDSVSPQGNAAAYSLTNHSSSMVEKSFTEHGYIICVAAVRTEHSYEQGLARMWSRKSRFDYYWPELATIGNQAVLNKEIYWQGNSQDDEAFGYQEAWADYRYRPSEITGAFRGSYAQSLNSWHYGDYYNQRPTLSSEWIDETHVNVDRTLAVSSEVEDQFFGDFYFKAEVTREMPLHSVPGLLDHY